MKEEYKLYKIKTALKLYSNSDPGNVDGYRVWREHRVKWSTIKDAKKYAQELGLEL